MAFMQLALVFLALLTVVAGEWLARSMAKKGQAFETHVRLGSLVVGVGLIIATGWIWLAIAACGLGLYYSLARYRETEAAWCRPMASAFAIACIALTGSKVVGSVIGSPADQRVSEQRRQHESILALESEGLGRYLAATCGPGTVLAVVLQDDPDADLRTDALRRGLDDAQHLTVLKVGQIIADEEEDFCHFTAAEWIELTRRNSHMTAIVNYAGLPDDLAEHTVAADASYGDPDRWDWRPDAEGAPLVIVGQLEHIRAAAVRSGRIIAVLARNPAAAGSAPDTSRYSDSTFAELFVLATPDNIAETAPLLRLPD